MASMAISKHVQDTVQRQPANVQRRQCAVTVFNIANIRTSGADLELNYSTRTGSHPLALRGMLTWQPHIKYERTGLPTVDQGGVAYGFGGLQASPSTRTTLLVRYGFTDRLSADLQTRWRNSMAMVGDPSLATSGIPIPSASFSNVNVNYRMPLATGELDAYLNVQNMFNKLAPPGSANYGTCRTTSAARRIHRASA